MRILIATDHYPPFIGGAHRQARLLAAGMAERGHDVAVATTWHGGLPPLDWEEHVTVRKNIDTVPDSSTGCARCGRGFGR